MGSQLWVPINPHPLAEDTHDHWSLVGPAPDGTELLAPEGPGLLTTAGDPATESPERLARQLLRGETEEEECLLCS